MTWDRIKTAGAGQVRYRVSVEGWPYDWVSDASLVQTRTTDSNREWILGLRSDGIEFAESIDPIRCEWDPSGFRCTVAGGDRQTGNTAAQSFAPPQQKTWLTSELSASATTVSVLSTSGFPSSGVIHLNTEAIAYTGTTSNTFTGCTRGIWDTAAQIHYVDGPDGALNPEVTDQPPVMEGRRCRVYAYGPGDTISESDPDAGVGTQIWFGVVSEDASFDGVTWAFTVDGPRRLLEGEIGTALADGASIRGIYYPDSAPLVIECYEGGGTGIPGISSNSTALAVSGFWETQQDFCTYLTTQLQDVMTNHAFNGTFTQASNVTAVVDGDSWAIQFVTDAATPVGMTFRGYHGASSNQVSVVDGAFTVNPFEVGDTTETPVSSVSASKTYQFSLQTVEGIERPGTVPRATLGASYAIEWAGGAPPPDNQYGIGSNPDGRIYLSIAPPSDAAVAKIDWSANGTGSDLGDTLGTNTHEIDTVDTTSNFIDLAEGSSRYRVAHFVATAHNPPEIDLGVVFTKGNLRDFLSAVTGAATYQAERNRAGIPDLRSTDLDLASSDIDEAADRFQYTKQRKYSLFSSAELLDMLTHEGRLIGCFPALISDGSSLKITWRKIRVPALSEVNSDTLNATTILVDDAFLGYEKTALGRVNRVIYSTGYNPREDKHTGDTVHVLWRETYGQSARGTSVEVKPKSQDPPGQSRDELGEELRRLAGRVLGTFGGEYRLVRLAVPISYFDVYVGDIVALTYNKVPNDTGTLGVTDTLGYVMRREWDMSTLTGMLTVLISGQRAAGYAPSGKISSISGASGGTSFTVTLGAGYFESGDSASNHFQTGDKIRLFEWDSTNTSNNVTGTVDSSGSPTGNDVTITTDSAWTHAGATWVLGYRVSSAITADSQKVYAFVAGSDGRVDWSGDADPAFTFSP